MSGQFPLGPPTGTGRLRAFPPGSSGCFSKTATRNPRSTSSWAADIPATPPPRTATLGPPLSGNGLSGLGSMGVVISAGRYTPNVGAVVPDSDADLQGSRRPGP